MIDGEAFGVRAAVRIRYRGDIRDLAGTLAFAFKLSAFSIEREEYEPFDEVGYAEAFGFEAWLHPLPDDGQGWYGLELETTYSIDEINNGRMYDISGWLARYVAVTCELEVEAAPRAV